jgi:hypothetical protein
MGSLPNQSDREWQRRWFDKGKKKSLFGKRPQTVRTLQPVTTALTAIQCGLCRVYTVRVGACMILRSGALTMTKRALRHLNINESQSLMQEAGMDDETYDADLEAHYAWRILDYEETKGYHTDFLKKLSFAQQPFMPSEEAD